MARLVGRRRFSPARPPVGEIRPSAVAAPTACAGAPRTRTCSMALSIIRFDMRAPGLEPARGPAALRAASRWRSGPTPRASTCWCCPSTTPRPTATCRRRWCWARPWRLAPAHRPVDLGAAGAAARPDPPGRGPRRARPHQQRPHLDRRRPRATGRSSTSCWARTWNRRGKLLDECLDIMIKAWTGEPFEYSTARPCRSRPDRCSSPIPTVMIGGGGPGRGQAGGPASGSAFFPSDRRPRAGPALPRRVRAPRHARRAGWASPSGPGTLFVSEDPDRLVGPHRPLPAARRHDLPVVAARGPAARTSSPTPPPWTSCGPRACTRSSPPTSAWRWPTRSARSAP